jgi:hypothetical protein
LSVSSTRLIHIDRSPPAFFFSPPQGISAQHWGPATPRVIFTLEAFRLMAQRCSPCKTQS